MCSIATLCVVKKLQKSSLFFISFFILLLERNLEVVIKRNERVRLSLECQVWSTKDDETFVKEVTKAMNIHQLAQALKIVQGNYLPLLEHLDISSVIEVFPLIALIYLVVMMIRMASLLAAVIDLLISMFCLPHCQKFINVLKVCYNFYVF